jgi:hypothetical protein
LRQRYLTEHAQPALTCSKCGGLGYTRHIGYGVNADDKDVEHVFRVECACASAQPSERPTDGEMLDWLEAHKSDAAFELTVEPADAEMMEEFGVEEDEDIVRIEYSYKRERKTYCAMQAGKTLRAVIEAAMSAQSQKEPLHPCKECGAPSLTGCACG